MSWLENLAECECGHLRGDHKTVRAPLGRPVLMGACRIDGCECRYYVEAVPAPENAA